MDLATLRENTQGLVAVTLSAAVMDGEATLDSKWVTAVKDKVLKLFENKSPEAAEFAMFLSLMTNDFKLYSTSAAKMTRKEKPLNQAHAILLQSMHVEGTKPMMLDMAEMFVKKYASANEPQKSVAMLWFNIKQ